MSAESRALEFEVIRPSSLDWREEDIVVYDGITSELAYHVNDQESESRKI